MIRRLWILSTCLLSVSSAQAACSGYSYERTITIDHTKVSTNALTYTDFAVFFSTTGVYLSTATGSGGRLNGGGFDVVYSTVSDCSFDLFWDTETINNTGSATRNEWIKIPSISSTTDTVFYQCYGNAGVTTYQGVSSSAWDSNYKGVWHLPDGVTLGLNDSTVNKTSATAVNTPTASAGKLDGAVTTINSSSSYLKVSSSVLSNAALTESAWISPNSFPNAYNSVITQNKDGNSYTDIHVKSSGKMAMYVHTVGGDSNYDGSGTNTLSAGSTYYVVLTYDNTVGLKGYVNGAVDGSAGSLGAALTQGDPQFQFGSNTRFAPRTFDGMIDEVRISNVVRSAAWIQTEYNNQNSPGTFVSIGSETACNPAAPAVGGTLPLSVF